MTKQREKAIQIAYASAALIHDICNPLFTSFGLNYFDFFRAYKDGSRVYLCSSVEWLEYQFQQKYWHTSNFSISIPDNIQHVPWVEITHFMPINDGVLFKEKHQDANTYFDFCNGIALIDHTDNYVDFYNFGAGKNNHLIYEIYLKDIDIFKRFILYFRETANPIIQQVIANRLRPIDNGQIAAQEGVQRNFAIQKEQFLKQTPINRLYFADSQTYLTKQEANCLKLLCSGLSVKQIAHQLGISPRSAEYYISKIKLKLNCSRQSELMSIAHNFSFFDAF